MADELKACPQNSTLWKALQKLKLTSNMWVILHSDISTGVICTNVLSLGKEKPPAKQPNGTNRLQNTLYHTATRTEEIESECLPKHTLIISWSTHGFISQPLSHPKIQIRISSIFRFKSYYQEILSR
jgi:hypothetical protein